MHVSGLEHWLAGNNKKACAVWQEILDQWPADMLALRFHHHGSFWSGDRKGLLSAPHGVLKAIGERAHGVNFVHGMIAFGFEENGDYENAESFGRRAMQANEHDLWSLHAVAHVFEMQCRHDEGLATAGPALRLRMVDHVMAFTDSHFMLALTGAGRVEAARGYLASLKKFARSGGNDAARVTQDVVVPLCEGLLAYAQGNDDEAADILYAMRHCHTPLGASHAQRDVFQQITIDAVTRAGQSERARQLLEDRQTQRPGGEWARTRLESLC